MLKNFKSNFIFLVLGLMAGMVFVTGSLYFYRSLKGTKVAKRYDVRPRKNLENGAGLFVASSLDRIFQDGKTLVPPSVSDTAVLSMAKNEYESFQIGVVAGANELKSVSLQASDLIDEATGAKIDKKNIEGRVVGYVRTETPYYPVKYVGLWPDPLLPAQDADIKPKMTQPFWVTIYAPPETPKGIYKGTLKVTGEGIGEQSIPLTVTVYDFTLPLESHLKTAFDFYGHRTRDRYFQGERESDQAYQARLDGLNDKFIIMMLKYRMNPVLNIDPTSQAELGRVDHYRVYGLNNFSIGKKGGTFGNNWPKDDESLEEMYSLYRTYGEILKLNKMLGFNYIYTWDEGKIGNPRVPKICSMIHRAYPGLKNMVCYHGFWEPETNPDWGKDIDIWCFQIDKFNEQKMRKLQDIGKEIWMYVSGPSGFTTPNIAIDFDSIDYRIIPWLCWKYDIKGFLYWCVNWWLKADPFKSAKTTDWEQNGNGFLFYPGKSGPVASLRAEIFRDGMEDYEYFQTLVEKIKEMKGKGLEDQNKELVSEAFKTLTVDNSIAESMFKFTLDGEALKARRNAIARMIEKFNSIFDAQNVSTQTQTGVGSAQ